jgi:hypothetical protein
MKKMTTLMLGTLLMGAGLFPHSAQAAEGQGFFNTFSPAVITPEKTAAQTPKAWNLIPTLPVEKQAEPQVKHGWVLAPVEDAPAALTQTSQPAVQHAWNLIPTLPVEKQAVPTVQHGWALAPAEDAPAAAATPSNDQTVQYGWNWNVPGYNSNKE